MSAEKLTVGHEVRNFPDPDLLALAAGINWLLHTEQPEGAILQHHGMNVGFNANRGYGFCPEASGNLPAITLDVSGWSWASSRIVGALTQEEVDATAAAITRLGVEITAQWNGAGAISGGFGLNRPAHASLLAAVARYRAGCPAHRKVFCGWQGSTAAERACTWYRDGNRLIIGPELAAASPEES